MLSVFIISVIFSVCVSSLCSLMEAALYAVPIAHIRHLSNSGSKIGRILLKLKDDIGRPIAAILILNTISNTAGAAVAGANAGVLWGETGVLVFSILFTLVILYASEIVPKQIGVSHCKVVANFMAYPLEFLVKILAPLISFSEIISKRFRGNEDGPTVSEEEVLSMADIGTEEGVLDHFEGDVIKNVVGLDKKTVGEILTPRVVVFRLEEDKKLSDVEVEIDTWNYSRVPLFKKDSPDDIRSYVNQRDILRELVKGNRDKTLSEISRPLKTIPEFKRIDELLLEMIAKGNHFFAVIDEHGGFDGVVSMEDVIETMLGREIVDEYDRVSDLRYYAQVIYSKKSGMAGENNSDVKVRRAKSEDAKAIFSLLRPFIEDGRIIEVSQEEVAKSAAQFFVCEENHELVAAAKFTEYENAVEIAKVCTTVDKQGSGKARFLVTKMLEIAKEGKKDFAFGTEH